MSELREKKNILLKNKCRILRMASNKEKVNIIKAYISLLEYYYSINGTDELDENLEIDPEFTEKFDQYIYSDTGKSVMELEDNAEKLYEKFETIIDTYKENEFCNYEYIPNIKVNKEKMEAVIWDFFASLGEDVLKVYYNMLKGGNILLKNREMDRIGYALDSTPIDNPCIGIQNIPNYLYFYTTLAHEIGHCYQFYLQRNQRKHSTIGLYCEITSILFEKLFIEYLKKNYMLKDESTITFENHTLFLNNISISKAICKLFKEKKIGIINPFNLDYTCEVSKEEIEKEIIRDCGYVKTVHTEPALSEIRYSFGFILANHFFRKIKEDFDSGWREFKDFICTINYLSMDDVIDKYFDMPIMIDNIKKFTKSYRER